MNLMAQVIERQQAIEEHQHTIRQRKVVLGVLANFLQLANRVVSEIADGSGSEWRQARPKSRDDAAAATPSQF